MPTWKEKYNKKYGYEKDKSHTLTQISKDTGVSKRGLQQIYNKGIGAWKTNIGSVRLKGSFKKNPNTKKYPRKARLGKEQWAMARVYSAVMGGKASKVDKKELKMQLGGETQITSNVKERIDFLKFILEFDRFGRSPFEIMSIQSELADLIRKTFKKGGELEEVSWTDSSQMIKNRLENQNNMSDFDRVEYYETYYKNVSPSTLSVDRNQDKIEISGFDKKYPKDFSVNDVKEYSYIQSLKKGGETDFNPDGSIKGKIVHNSGEVGGMLVGKRHSEGGIKAINKSTGQPLEMEGGEVVITRDAVSDPKKRSFNGKMMTNRQILSAINESGGGVSFADGGEVPDNVNFDCNAEYEYGGKTMCGKDLASYLAMGGVTTAIVTDPNEAMSDLQSTYGFGDVYQDGGVIECQVCSWSWDKKDGGDDMYVCHKCGTDNSKFEKGGNLDKVIGGFPYRIEGSKAIISTYLPDDTKERIIKRAKENGYYASPNMGGGVSIFLKKFEKGGEIYNMKGTDLPVFYYKFESDFYNGIIQYQTGEFSIDSTGFETFPRYGKFNRRLTSLGELNLTKKTLGDESYDSLTALPFVDFSNSYYEQDTYYSQLNELYDRLVERFAKVGDEFKVGNRTLVFERLSRLDIYLKDKRRDLPFFMNKIYVNSLFNPLGEVIAYVELSSTDFYDKDGNMITVDKRAYSLDELVAELLRLHEISEKTQRSREISISFTFADDKIPYLLTRLNISPRKPKANSSRANYTFSASALKTDIPQFLHPLFYELKQDLFNKVKNFTFDVPTINLFPFLTGNSEIAKKIKSDLEKQEKLKKQQEKKEKEEKLLRESFVATISDKNFFQKDFIEKDNKLLKDKEALLLLLPSFQGVQFSVQRAKIIRELSKIEKELQGLAEAFDYSLFSNEGLLDYYYQQTTQSPVKALDKPSELPTPNGEQSKLPLGAYLNVRSIQFKDWFGDWETAYEDKNYTNCSVMIDESTKEPKIFYHGVRRFNPNLKGGAMGSGVTRPYGAFTPTKFPASYFSDKKSYAEFYSGQSKDLPKGVRSDGFIYPVFLNVRNPLDLRPLGFETSYQDFRDYIAVVSGINLKFSQNVVEKLKDLKDKNPVWSYIRNDIQVLETLKDFGYDGVIQIGDIPVFGEDGEPLKNRNDWRQEDEYLTFYPNQVKSAVAKKSFFLDMFEDVRFKMGGYVSL